MVASPASVVAMDTLSRINHLIARVAPQIVANIVQSKADGCTIQIVSASAVACTAATVVGYHNWPNFYDSNAAADWASADV